MRLAVYEDQVGPDVAVAVMPPRPAERVIEIAVRQRLVIGQQSDRCGQHRIEALAVLSRFLPFVVSPEAGGVINNPYSGS